MEHGKASKIAAGYNADSTSYVISRGVHEGECCAAKSVTYSMFGSAASDIIIMLAKNSFSVLHPVHYYLML